MLLLPRKEFAIDQMLYIETLSRTGSSSSGHAEVAALATWFGGQVACETGALATGTL